MQSPIESAAPSRFPMSQLQTFFYEIMENVQGAAAILVFADLAGAVKEHHVRAALDLLALRHPTLHTTPVKEVFEDGTAGLYLQEGAEQHTLHWRCAKNVEDSDDALLPVMASLDLRRTNLVVGWACDESGLNHRCVFGVSHIVADGRMAFTILKELLVLIDCAITQEELRGAGARVTLADAGMSVLPPPRSLVSRLPARFINGDGSLKEVDPSPAEDANMEDFMKKKLVLPNESIEREIIPRDQLQPFFFRETLDAQEFTRLSSTCKAHGTSVHGALAAALMCALAETLMHKGLLEKADAMDVAGLVSTVDKAAREDNKMPYPELAAFSASLLTFVDVPCMAHVLQDHGAFFALATAIRDDIMRSLANDLGWHAMVNFERQSSATTAKIARDFLPFPNGPNVMLMNTGSVDPPSRPLTHFTLCDMSQVLTLDSSLLGVNVTTFGGRMHLYFSACLPRSSEATMRTFAEACMRHLRRVVT